jgi:uncharacterized membrane protein YfcA
VHDALLALPFGLAIGLLLGLVGGGGSILAVPVLVYILGEPVEAATTESLLIVGVTALVGAVVAARAQRVHVRIALAFAAAGAATAVAGTALNRLAGSRVIMLGFALMLLAAAYALVGYRTVRMAGPANDGKAPAWARVTTAGAATGLLTGFFGVGGGFVIVPALALVLGLPMTLAVGTSLLVIALTSAAALVAHLATGTINLPLSAAFTLAAVAGAVAGTRLHGQIPEPLLRRLFALLLVGVAAFVVAKNAGG